MKKLLSSYCFWLICFIGITTNAHSINGLKLGDFNPYATINGTDAFDSLNEMKINSVSLVQTELPTGLGDSDQRILAIKVSVSGSMHPLNLNSIKFK